jgi:hypothetical protein
MTFSFNLKSGVRGRNLLYRENDYRENPIVSQGKRNHNIWVSEKIEILRKNKPRQAVTGPGFDQ